MIAKALTNLGYSDCQWRISGEEIYENLIWGDKNERPAPTKSEIDAEVKRLQAEYDAQEYARKRAEAYPSVGDQLDMIYKDMKNSTTTHAEAVEAVKTKFPKE